MAIADRNSSRTFAILFRVVGSVACPWSISPKRIVLGFRKETDLNGGLSRAGSFKQQRVDRVDVDGFGEMKIKSRFLCALFVLVGAPPDRSIWSPSSIANWVEARFLAADAVAAQFSAKR